MFSNRELKDEYIAYIQDNYGAASVSCGEHTEMMVSLQYATERVMEWIGGRSDCLSSCYCSNDIQTIKDAIFTLAYFKDHVNNYDQNETNTEVNEQTAYRKLLNAGLIYYGN